MGSGMSGCQEGAGLGGGGGNRAGEWGPDRGAAASQCVRAHSPPGAAVTGASARTRSHAAGGRAGTAQGRDRSVPTAEPLLAGPLGVGWGGGGLPGAPPTL